MGRCGYRQMWNDMRRVQRVRQSPAFSIAYAAWITVGTYFVIRLLTIRFNWQTRSVWEGGNS